MTFVSVQSYGLAQKLTVEKRDAEIVVEFITKNFVPSTGTFEIVFPSSVPRIKADCRSVTSLGSGLMAQSGASGEIGCDVQNERHWVITSFQDVAANTRVIIRGFIDLPSSSGGIGVGQIISYSSTHPTNISMYGPMIDFVSADFGLVVSSPSMHTNPDILLSQREVVRAGTVG